MAWGSPLYPNLVSPASEVSQIWPLAFSQSSSKDGRSSGASIQHLLMTDKLQEETVKSCQQVSHISEALAGFEGHFNLNPSSSS